MKDKRMIAATVVYSVIVTHFLFTNFYQAIGPRYLIKSSGYTRELASYCPEGGDTSDCHANCPIKNMLTAHSVKGFPFQINQYDNDCTSVTAYSSKDFTEAMILNATIFAAITVVYLAVMYSFMPKKEVYELKFKP